MVVAAGFGLFLLLGVGCAAEFTAPDDERIVEQAALLEVFHQSGAGLVGVPAIIFNAVGQVAVLIGDDPIGVVTSGNFSPVLGHGIALAMVRPDVTEGVTVDLDVRGTRLAGTVVPTPFVTR